jgi:RNA polymerase sigma factor (TIGR02999 family)
MGVSADDGCGQITALLKRQRAGDREAFDQLVSMVYGHLRRVARGQLAAGWPSETLSATALVHEAYLQLRHETRVDWQGREHFFAIAARAMRRILVDHARYRRAAKRAYGREGPPIEDVDLAVDTEADRVLAIDEALSALEQVSARMGQIVECRFFAGMTEDETAAALGVSLRTVQREWMRARAWLVKTLGSGVSLQEPVDRGTGMIGEPR